MTFRFTDRDGDRFEVRSATNTIKLDALDVVTLHRVILAVPLDRVEELIAGIRDTARQAALEQQP
jgi:hypothetical protein